MPLDSKQFFPFRPIGDSPLQITYDDIREAMNEMSQARKSTAAGKTYAVLDPQTGNTYPPKEVLNHIITRLKPGRRYSFFGGKGWDGANRVFQEFGFPVGNSKKLVERWKTLKSGNDRIPNVDQLLKTLFSQRWRFLPTGKELVSIVSKSSGVYALAYSSQKLQGKIVHEKDVFYVGMTCEGGLNVRLRMFRDGIGHSKRLTLRKGVAPGILHSAAARFRRIWLRGKPYEPTAPTRLYFAYVSLNSETEKPWRTPSDLRNLGKVVDLEYAAIARVKKAIGHEPLLNSK
jgi:hypothetical protein